MGCAPMAHVLFRHIMRYNPKNPTWFNRDRFVLSNGHSCALLYCMLHLTQCDMPMEALKDFRQLDSVTAGHPENIMHPAIEVTTGPLGQGVANAVGLAIASKHLGAKFNTEAGNLVDNNVFVICGDGCLQEGVSGEASSLAGHLGLGNLIMLYDDNQITIDGSTELSFSEDVLGRYEAYGWHTMTVADGDHDVEGLKAAIEEAKRVTDKPTIIKVRTTIGFSSAMAGTAKVHGSPLTADDLADVKRAAGMDPEAFFSVSDEVYAAYADAAQAGAEAENAWNETLAALESANPELAAEFKRRIAGELPEGWEAKMPTYTADDKAEATRALSGKALNALATALPEIMGGSADLTGSNVTALKGDHDFQAGSYIARYLRFGVREHGMAAITNGLAAFGGIVPFAATFLNFIGYAAGATRLSSLSHLRVLYICTHDSIGLGEDGPTHQPVEMVSMLRATPNTLVQRPADGNETSAAYIAAMRASGTPSYLCLTRQSVPHLAGSSIEKALKGAYTVRAADVDTPAAIIIATGSEVGLALEAADKLAADGVQAAVVSAPCLELFEKQSLEYRQSVLVKGVPVVSVEALSTSGWSRYAHASVGMTTFGKSAPAKQVYEALGITAEAVADKAKKVVEFYAGAAPVLPVNLPF